MRQRIPSQEATLPAAAHLFADRAVFPAPAGRDADHLVSGPPSETATLPPLSAPSEEELMTLSIAEHRDYLDWQENQNDASSSSLVARLLYGVLGGATCFATLFVWLR